MEFEHSLPLWQSHKQVRAGKIKAVRGVGNGYSELVLEVDTDCERVVRISDDWRMRDLVQVGGYYVEYTDQYASYSPAVSFEAGYTRV